MNNQPTILLVDDDKTLSELLTTQLRKQGYNVLPAGTGKDALELLGKNEVDVVLADISMPEMNGYQLFQSMQEKPEWAIIPFVLITARGFDSDVRYGKELGVDDYLVKPFTVADLVATIQGRMKRMQMLAHAFSVLGPQTEVPSTQIIIGDLVIDLNRRSVSYNGEHIHLTGNEYRLMLHLAQRPNTAVMAEDLVEATHGHKNKKPKATSSQPGLILRPLVRALRQKLTVPEGEPGYIETVRGVGYLMLSE
ncbi:MAG: response regulator transcription factor [Chloroflexi bacterium]|nr:response regulator transcription factor [Chloroflexota bacterium]MBP8055460.1 response regulator transcription factor [Chloroflexota bacterium]